MALLEEEGAGRNAEALAGGGEELQLQALAVTRSGHGGGPRRHARAQVLPELQDALPRQLAERGAERAERGGPVGLASGGEHLLGAAGERFPRGAGSQLRGAGGLQELGGESRRAGRRARRAPD